MHFAANHLNGVRNCAALAKVHTGRPSTTLRSSTPSLPSATTSTGFWAGRTMGTAAWPPRWRRSTARGSRVPRHGRGGAAELARLRGRPGPGGRAAAMGHRPSRRRAARGALRPSLPPDWLLNGIVAPAVRSDGAPVARFCLAPYARPEELEGDGGGTAVRLPAA